MRPKTLVVFITTPGPQVSRQLARGLLEGKWAACVNRISGMTSQYSWKGAIESSQEDLLIVKPFRGNGKAWKNGSVPVIPIRFAKLWPCP